jgi:hypothetical protein
MPGPVMAASRLIFAATGLREGISVIVDGF